MLKWKVFFAAAVLFSSSPLLWASSEEGGDDLRGPAFSDPSAMQEMPEGWENKPLEYASGNEEADLVVSLNQQFYEFIDGYIGEFAQEKGVKIVTQKGTCGLSAGMIKNKQGDVGAFCCPPGRIDRLPGLRFHTIGIHPISILVHPDNPVNSLSLGHVRKIFQGEIFNWSEVGPGKGPIRVVARLHCKKRPGHWKLLLGSNDLFGPDITEVGAIEDMFSLVSTTQSAIGFEVMWMSSELGDKVKTLKLDGMSPEDLEHLVKGDYPLYRTLNLTTWEREPLRKPIAVELVEFINEKIEKLGDREGIIPVSRLKQAGWIFKGSELIGEPQ